MGIKYITSRGISGLNLLAANSHLCLGVSSIVAIGIFSGSGQDYLVEDHSVSKEKNATANSDKGDLIMYFLPGHPSVIDTQNRSHPCQLGEWISNP